MVNKKNRKIRETIILDKAIRITKQLNPQLLIVIITLVFGCSQIELNVIEGNGDLISTNRFVPLQPQIDPILGPQSRQATGEQRVLIVAVRFPDWRPSIPFEKMKQKVEASLRYIGDQSYGKAWVKTDFVGWVTLKAPLKKYSVSRYNFGVDKSRIKKLIKDTMTAIEDQVDFSVYQHMIIVPCVYTSGGQGYGMVYYNANPGMLGTTRKRGYYYRKYITVRSEGGKTYSGGISMGTENAHPGVYPYDFMYHLGGIHENRRLLPCQYDFKRQSDPSVSRGHQSLAIYVGPWDIMSQVFIEESKPPQGTTSFTKIRLGWITADEVVQVMPGERKTITLSPLSIGGETLAVKIPLQGGQYYLVENRQLIGYDAVLPDSGILILKVDPKIAEGSGPVRVIPADPNAPRFLDATYKPGETGRDRFIDQENGVVVMPIMETGGNITVRITTPKDAQQAQKTE